MDNSGKKLKVYVDNCDYSDLVIERSILVPIGAEEVGVQRKAGKGIAELVSDADPILWKFTKIRLDGYAEDQKADGIGVACIATSIFVHTDLFAVISELCDRIMKSIPILSKKLIRTSVEISNLFRGVNEFIFTNFTPSDDKREINANIITTNLQSKGDLA